MSLPTRLVTLERRWLRRYSKQDVRDLAAYLEPDVLLVTGEVSPRKIRWLERATDRVVACTEEPDVLETPELRLVLAPRFGDAERLFDRSSHDRRLCVVSSFLREQTHPETFSLEWEFLEEYGELCTDIPPDTQHLAVNLRAGRSVCESRASGPLIHGAGPVEDQQRSAIPCLRIGEDVVLEESLPADKVGVRAIQGVGRKLARRLRSHSLDDRQRLAETDPEQLLRVEGIGPHYASVLPAGARALERNEVVWFDSNPLVDRSIVYVDIETDALRPSNIWQIGVLDEQREHYRSFYQTKDPDDAGTVPRAFARWVHEQAPDRTFVAWYGNKFDFVWLDRFVERYAEPSTVQTWKNVEKVDLLQDVVRSRLRLPVRSHRLGVVARRLGYERRETGLTGRDAARAYARWSAGGDLDWERWTAYCRDDVMAMHHVVQRLRGGVRPFDKDELARLYQSRAHQTVGSGGEG